MMVVVQLKFKIKQRLGGWQAVYSGIKFEFNFFLSYCKRNEINQSITGTVNFLSQ